MLSRSNVFAPLAPVVVNLVESRRITPTGPIVCPLPSEKAPREMLALSLTVTRALLPLERPNPLLPLLVIELVPAKITVPRGTKKYRLPIEARVLLKISVPPVVPGRNWALPLTNTTLPPKVAVPEGQSMTLSGDPLAFKVLVIVIPLPSCTELLHVIEPLPAALLWVRRR